MRVTYVGNFKPKHSTENEILRAMRSLGWEVRTCQEDELVWRNLHMIAQDEEADFVLWTRTWALDHAEQHAALRQLTRASISSVGYHLDRWWGLEREHLVNEEPFFTCDLVITADGGHQEEFEKAGVNHVWFPPAVSELECRPGTPDVAFESDVAFVGSWRPGYHPEWGHRQQLVGWLMAEFGDRCKFWPKADQPAIRGEDLRNLYASVKVVVGDSCLVPDADGTPCDRYWSDRIPETLGRGGFLLHPWVDGLDEQFNVMRWTSRDSFTLIPDTDPQLVTWEVGDWWTLRERIEHYLEHDADRRTVADAGQAHVKAWHTYAVRMRQLEMLLNDRGML